MPPLRLCLVSAEVAPFAKSGGLADVSAALARYLGDAGHDVRLFMPFHSTIERDEHEILPVEFLRSQELGMGGRHHAWSLHTTRLPGSSTWLYLVACPELYDRPDLYSGDADDARRFAFLARAALESCQRMGFAPDVFHAHDWHAALLPLYLRTHYGWDDLFRGSGTLLTIHNIAYQGVFGSDLLPALELDWSTHLLARDDLAQGAVNFLRTGILHSDWLSTVSPTHAREIQGAEYGMGLDGLLRARSDRLVGILNGVDYDVWSPERDELIPHRYSAEDLAGKELDKRALLQSMGLPHDPDVPVLGIVSRLVSQKGFDLVFGPLAGSLAHRDLRLVVLGSGEPRYEEGFADLARRFPDKVCQYRGYSEKLAHLVEAGADIFLMPSRYEPCGLNQMYSLRYGTPPLVRRTGGLADAVEHWNPAERTGTGFVFEHFTPEGFAWALGEALAAWEDREGWRQLQRNAMAQDFSWEHQVGRYEELYRAVTATGTGSRP